MILETATPETGTVDAPVSMDDIIAEIATGEAAPDATAEVVKELVEEAEEGHSEEEADQGDATEAAEEDEETAEEEPEEQEEGPEPTHKVKVNGQEVEVPLSELLKGYSREQDYTSKTMALADERKKLSGEFASELEKHLEVFRALDPILSEAQNIDWNKLAQDDPKTYVQLHAAYEARVAQVTEVENRIAAERKAATEAEGKARAEADAKETEKLIAAVPELGDEAKMKSFATNTVNYLRGTGYQDDEIINLTDHRALQIVDKARRWDELQNARKSLPGKKVNPPPSKAASLRTDGADSSRAPQKRFPVSAPRERQLGYVVNEILRDMKE